MNASKTGPAIATADGQTWWGCEALEEFGGVFDPALLGSPSKGLRPRTNGQGWLYDGTFNSFIIGPFGSELEANQWLRQQESR